MKSVFALPFIWAVSTAAQGMGGGARPPTTTVSDRPPTTVWVTSTLPGGKKTAVASVYTQQYVTMYSSVAVPSSGMIGLGTQTGEVGRVRASRAAGARALPGGFGLRAGIMVLGLVL